MTAREIAMANGDVLWTFIFVVGFVVVLGIVNNAINRALAKPSAEKNGKNQQHDER